MSKKSQFKMIARSVGYRMGKLAARRHPLTQECPDFTELFSGDYADEATKGYNEGLQFVQTGQEAFHKG